MKPMPYWVGVPQINTNGLHPYKAAIRDAFRSSAHCTIAKTYNVVDVRKDAAHRYSPAT